MSSGTSETIEEKLARIRREGDAPKLPVPLTWNSEYTLRPYQRVGAAHLAVRKRFILGDPTGVGKTPTELYSWALIREIREREKSHSRLWVVTTKSAVDQWVDEVKKFLPSITTYHIPDKSKGVRIAYFKEWAESKKAPILICNWAQFCNDWAEVQTSTNITQWLPYTQVVLDECQKVKNPASFLGKTARLILDQADRVHGLTATLIKNRAHDAQAVVEAICPGTMSLGEFEARYAIKEWVWVKIRGRRRQIQKITGYHNLEHYKEHIKEIYLGRTDEELEGQRPFVTFMKRTVHAGPEQRKIYSEAERGFLVAANTESSMYALGHAIQAACCPEMWYDMPDSPFSVKTKESAKAKLLLEILETELEGEPCVIYCALETVISAYERQLRHLNPVRITGVENTDEREKNRQKFQNGETNILLITDAGGEALNLQRGKHVIFLSRPWDVGRYIQVIGRIRRFGSEHGSITVWHLNVADTIDDLIDAVLYEKYGDFETLLRSVSTIPESAVQPKDIATYARRRRIGKL